MILNDLSAHVRRVSHLVRFDDVHAMSDRGQEIYRQHHELQLAELQVPYLSLLKRRHVLLELSALAAHLSSMCCMK